MNEQESIINQESTSQESIFQELYIRMAFGILFIVIFSLIRNDFKAIHISIGIFPDFILIIGILFFVWGVYDYTKLKIKENRIC